jgi:hypothetical protein
MPGSFGELIIIGLGFVVVWLLWGSFASGEFRRRGGHPGVRTPERPRRRRRAFQR